MAIQIGHSSVDENGRYNSGTAGDQTGKEVCVRNWYNNGWSVLLRAKDSAVAEKIAKACEDGCANNKIGYDQYQRNTLRARAKEVNWDLSKITTACECDCASFVTVCAEAAGINMDSTYTSGNAPVTSTMRSKFKATGAFDVLTDSKYLTGTSYLQRGDILVKETAHTVIVLGTGANAGTETTPTTGTKLTVDGRWGSATTKRLQTIFGTTVDGIVSNQDARFKSVNPGLVGGWDWQTKPNGKGSALIKAMQKWAGMTTANQDGEIGPVTIKALQTKLGTTVDGKVSNPSLMVKALQKWANEQ